MRRRGLKLSVPSALLPPPPALLLLPLSPAPLALEPSPAPVRPLRSLSLPATAEFVDFCSGLATLPRLEWNGERKNEESPETAPAAACPVAVEGLREDADLTIFPFLGSLGDSAVSSLRPRPRPLR